MIPDEFTFKFHYDHGVYVATCDQYPSLSWIENTKHDALAGLLRLVADVILDLEAERSGK